MKKWNGGASKTRKEKKFQYVNNINCEAREKTSVSNREFVKTFIFPIEIGILLLNKYKYLFLYYFCTNNCIIWAIFQQKEHCNLSNFFLSAMPENKIHCECRWTKYSYLNQEKYFIYSFEVICDVFNIFCTTVVNILKTVGKAFFSIKRRNVVTWFISRAFLNNTICDWVIWSAYNFVDNMGIKEFNT